MFYFTDNWQKDSRLDSTGYTVIITNTPNPVQFQLSIVWYMDSTGYTVIITNTPNPVQYQLSIVWYMTYNSFMSLCCYPFPKL